MGLLAGIAGVLLIVIPGDSLPAPSMAVWFLIALLIPFGFGALNVIVERFRPPEASSLGLAIGNLFAGALLLLPFLPATGQLYLFPGPDPDGDLALAAAVVINAIMWPMFYVIVRRAGASLFSIMTIIGVVVASAGDSLLRRDPFRLCVGGGGAHARRLRDDGGGLDPVARAGGPQRLSARRSPSAGAALRPARPFGRRRVPARGAARAVPAPPPWLYGATRRRADRRSAASVSACRWPDGWR